MSGKATELPASCLPQPEAQTGMEIQGIALI